MLHLRPPQLTSVPATVPATWIRCNTVDIVRVKSLGSHFLIFGVCWVDESTCMELEKQVFLVPNRPWIQISPHLWQHQSHLRHFFPGLPSIFELAVNWSPASQPAICPLWCLFFLISWPAPAAPSLNTIPNLLGVVRAKSIFFTMVHVSPSQCNASYHSSTCTQLSLYFFVLPAHRSLTFAVIFVPWLALFHLSGTSIVTCADYLLCSCILPECGKCC